MLTFQQIQNIGQVVFAADVQISRSQGNVGALRHAADAAFIFQFSVNGVAAI